MTRTFWSRLVLGLAVLTAPAVLLGCSEETKPAADATATPAPTPAPAGDAKTPAPAPDKAK